MMSCRCVTATPTQQLHRTTEPEQALQLLRAAISACEKGVEPEQALQLLREMLRQSVEPDVIRYNAAISACEKEFESSRWRRPSRHD